MLTISKQEELTSNYSDASKLEFLIEDIISSWLYYSHKRRNIIDVQSEHRNSTEAPYKLQLQYQDANTLRLLANYISQLKKEIQQHHTIQDKTQTIQEIPIKVIDALSRESSESNIQITQNRLIELLQEDDEDDEGILKPTAYAFDKAWKLVYAASQFMKNNFPKAWVSTNDEGGIRLTWSQKAEAEVRLICATQANKPTYLYYEHGKKYGVVNDVSGLSLAGWLQWLNQV